MDERKLYWITYKLKKQPLEGLIGKQNEGWTPYKRPIVLSEDEYRAFTTPPSKAVAVVMLALLRGSPDFLIADVVVTEAKANADEGIHVQA